MLQRHVDVLHQVAVFGNGVEQFLGDAIRVAVQKANPFLLLGLDLCQPSQQDGQTVFQAKVFPIAGGVLPDQVNLPHTLTEESGGFGNDRLKTSAAELPSVLRNHAERARVVATFRDLHIREVARRGQNPWRQIVVEIQPVFRRRDLFLDPFANRPDLVQFVGADQGIHFRHVRLDIAAVALDEATGHHQALRPPHFLVLGHFQNRIDRFLLGRVNKAAGVYDQDIGLIGMGSEFMPT